MRPDHTPYMVLRQSRLGRALPKTAPARLDIWCRRLYGEISVLPTP